MYKQIPQMSDTVAGPTEFMLTETRKHCLDAPNIHNGTKCGGIHPSICCFEDP